MNMRVEEILFEGTEALRHEGTSTLGGALGRWGVRLRRGEEVRGDAVVLATNHHAVQRWIPEELKATRWAVCGVGEVGECADSGGASLV